MGFGPGRHSGRVPRRGQGSGRPFVYLQMQVGCIDAMAWRAQQESDILLHVVAVRMAMSSAVYMVAIGGICLDALR